MQPVQHTRMDVRIILSSRSKSLYQSAKVRRNFSVEFRRFQQPGNGPVIVMHET